MALAIQKVTEEVMLKMATEAKRITGATNLCLAGGVALNCVANGLLSKSNIFKHIFVQPAAGDAGGAPGAAWAAYHIFYNKDRTVQSPDAMNGSLLGPDFSVKEINYLTIKYKAVFHQYDDVDLLNKKVAQLINDGKVIGWVQGRMEFGPRALGARSILADPRNTAMQRKVNLKIKNRESFRPFAPILLEEDCSDYFDFDGTSPYMLNVQQVSDKIKTPLPTNYHELSMQEKLKHSRSTLPAITHVDYSARLQTVGKNSKAPIRQLLEAFKALTGCSVLINTSFNVRGEPIVCTPEDAYQCFMKTDMDFLVVGNCLFAKEEQGGD